MSVTVGNVGIIGAGTMGGGITIAFANAGFSVQLVDVNVEAIDSGRRRIRDFYDDAIRREKMSVISGNANFDRIQYHSTLSAVAECDIVIEAVFEDIDLKSRIAADLGRLCRQDAILASNTSSLDIDVIAQASGRPGTFIGIHFFSPAHIMKLVEVVRGKVSDPAVVAAAVEMVKALGKVPVVCGVGFGFIGNRMAEPYLREADALLLEGASPARIDAIAQSPDYLGMAMGPCRMMDLAGLDIGASIIAERAATTGLLDDESYRSVVRALAGTGYLGQKSGRGFYRYEGRQAIDEPATIRLAQDLAAQHGVTRRAEISDEEILQRLLYPLINEGFEVLREGIADTSDDIDVVFTAGFGFPKARGGPMAMARSIGLERIRQQFEIFAETKGNSYGYWTPSPFLKEQVDAEETAL